VFSRFCSKVNVVSKLDEKAKLAWALEYVKRYNVNNVRAR